MLTKLLYFYRRYLAPFLIFRLLKAVVLEAYKQAYYFFCQINNHPDSGKYYWKALHAVDAKNCRKKQVILFDPMHRNLIPDFCGHKSNAVKQKFNSPTYSGLDILAYELLSARVIGGIDVQLTDNKIIHHELFDPAKHTCPAENVGVIRLHRRASSVTLYLFKRSFHVEKAISLIGQCSHNYAHWLTETLPKLSAANLLADYQDWPLLIDKNLHPNILESIRLLNRQARLIIQVEKWQSVSTNHLLVLSTPGYERYVPQGIMTTEPPPYLNKFSSAALALLRTSLLKSVDTALNSSHQQYYFARSISSSNLRTIHNAEEISNLLSRRGVKLLEPEKLSFQQQIELCSNATLIIAPIGATLANMIFAPPGCRIIVLAPYYEKASYFYYANLAAALNHKLTYVLGFQVGEKRQAMHRDYCIDPLELLIALKPSV